MNKRMNNLIQALADKASQHAMAESWSNGPNRDRSFRDLKDEEFARLIVEKCSMHCDLLLDNKISSEWIRGTHSCAIGIKKLFDF